jgi:hypothetical protein
MDERVSDGFWQEVLSASKLPLAIAGAFVVGLLAWLFWPVPPDESIDIAAKIEPPPPAELVLDAASASSYADRTLIAAERLVVKGVVSLERHHVLVANELAFEPESRLVLPSGHITVLAPRVHDAVIDVSGAPGKAGAAAGEDGHDGSAGGSIVLAAGEVINTRLIARGGDGGNGQRGYSGAAGQRGYCGPNGFRIAERGESGGDGGNGGAGGPGGLVMMMYRYDPAAAEVAAGKPGAGAEGGPGGAGGRGCNGVRGVQKAQGPGNDGARGRPGSVTSDGTVSSRRVAFWDVVRAFADWREEDNEGDPRKLRDRLRPIPTLSE